MERVLGSCCGFLHDMDPVSEKLMIERYMKKVGSVPGLEASGLKRRAFLVTSMPLDGSVELVPGRFILTMTGWDPETAKAKGTMPKESHHVNNYNDFRVDLIMDSTVLNVVGFDGDLDARDGAFSALDAKEPNKPHLAILSNMQHEKGEPFLLKHGYKPIIRGCNNFWYNNHLTVFVKLPANEAKKGDQSVAA